MSEIANNLRVNDIIEIDNQKFRITNSMHVKPGKGGAFMQLVLQNIEKDQKKEVRFRTDEKVNKITIYDNAGTFLYKEGNNYVFLDKTSFEEVRFANPQNSEFLVDGCDVIIVTTESDEILTVKLPQVVVCQVDLTAGYISGQSATAQEKSALLTNGVSVKVPQHIKDGDMIQVDLETMKFVKKA